MHVLTWQLPSLRVVDAEVLTLHERRALVEEFGARMSAALQQGVEHFVPHGRPIVHYCLCEHDSVTERDPDASRPSSEKAEVHTRHSIPAKLRHAARMTRALLR